MSGVDSVLLVAPWGRHYKRGSIIPYNPELYRMVESKRDWAVPLSAEAEAAGFLGWHQRGFLPHRDAPDLMQMVTVRLEDSFPKERREEWESLLRIEKRKEKRQRLEEYLDRGHGACWLRSPAVANAVKETLLAGNPHDYGLAAWVVMPNHVHVLVQTSAQPLSEIIRLWKGRIARQANIALVRRGSFWQAGYWDTFMRDEEQLRKACNYIENNPVKAGLCKSKADWPLSSATKLSQG